MGIITSRIFKPKRLLYFIVPTKDEIDDYYLGIIPDALKIYDGAFGTYDSPGIFHIRRNGIMTEIIGIEYRPDDDRVEYPDLQHTVLNPSFMIQALFTDTFFDKNNIQNYIDHIKYTMRDSIFRSKMIGPLEYPEVLQITTTNTHNKITIQADEITKEEFFETFNIENKTESRLFDLAFKEPITGAYNWNYIWPKIAGFGLCDIQDFAFVHFDVKDFNAINVVYSHDAGDNVLIKIAEKMKELDWVYESARCHNDNFAMMIKDMPLAETKRKLKDFFNSISSLDDDPNYTIYYRCGVVPMKHTLLLGDRVADAGKHVQRSGNKKHKTQILFYTDEINDNIDWSEKVKAYLDTALANHEFIPYLQPKFDIHTGQIVGAEALVRWLYQKQSFISPGRFVPILETGGLINKIDDYILKRVCEYFVKWKKEGYDLYPISINLSRTRIGDARLVEYLTEIVDSYGVEHSLIDFELTESAAYDDKEEMIYVINELKNQGFTVSIDDFGTGFSSLSLLTTMHFDTLKIDKSFVDGIMKANNKNDLIVLKSIIDMAKKINLCCLAEGVEEKEQVDLLKRYGCEVIQGYYYSKPLPLHEYENLLINN